MKLTKFDKEAFVRAVMDDVPFTDYDEQARKIALAAAGSKLPPKVRAIWNDKELRGFIKCERYVRTPGCLGSMTTPDVEFMTPQLTKQLEELAAAKKAQRESRNALENNLSAIVASCATLKQAHERLPEFSKYLPAERGASGTANLPAVANVVAELTKAGWPKGKRKGAN